jgi:hypothetical protein
MIPIPIAIISSVSQRAGAPSGSGCYWLPTPFTRIWRP